MPQLHRTASHSWVSSYGGSTADHDLHRSGTLGIGVATQVTMRVVVTTPLTVSLSLAFEPKPPPLLGT
jgi:hypothetical protein